MKALEKQGHRLGIWTFSRCRRKRGSDRLGSLEWKVGRREPSWRLRGHGDDQGRVQGERTVTGRGSAGGGGQVGVSGTREAVSVPPSDPRALPRWRNEVEEQAGCLHHRAGDCSGTLAWAHCLLSGQQHPWPIPQLWLGEIFRIINFRSFPISPVPHEKHSPANPP